MITTLRSYLAIFLQELTDLAGLDDFDEEILRFHSLRHPWQTAVLKWLVSKKENEIWEAALWRDDGEIKRLLEEFEEAFYSSDEMRDLETNPDKEFHSKSRIATAVANNFIHSDEIYFIPPDSSYSQIKFRMETIADQLANTSRELTSKEQAQIRTYEGGTYSILWIAIHRQHLIDVDYLLKNRNIELHTRNGYQQETALHEAVWNRNEQIIESILGSDTSASPSGCVDLCDVLSETPLHTVFKNHALEPFQDTSLEGDRIFRISTVLLDHGANINALNEIYHTPLHLLLQWGYSDAQIGPLLNRFLAEGAEVNSKDFQGRTPLHVACHNNLRQTIRILVEKGADLQTIDHQGQRPKSYLKTSTDNEEFWAGLEILVMTSMAKHRNHMKLPSKSVRIPKRRMDICDKTPVYCRIQRNFRVKDRDSHVSPYWVGTDRYVSDVLYQNAPRHHLTFLQDCERKSRKFWMVIEDHVGKPFDPLTEANVESGQRCYNSWRWVNFPANNMTWVKDFILDHIEQSTSPDSKRVILEFIQNNIRVRDTKERISRIRSPHAQSESLYSRIGNAQNNVMTVLIKQQRLEKHEPKSRSVDSSNMLNAGSMVSIVIPFLDIEVAQPNVWGKSHDRETYLPFTGIDGIQMPQTLDQTFNNVESFSGLRSKENQVIYRWCEKQAPTRWMQFKHPTNRFKRFLLRYWPGYQPDEDPDPGNAAFDYIRQVNEGDKSSNPTRMRSIQQEIQPKWLMVRQLWLWELHDGTILTAIPSRDGKCMADDLLETIQNSELGDIFTSDDLMKHIVQQTVTFTEKFRVAGLGEHILDIFENELASEIDREAGFFNSFTRKDWNSRYVNNAISEAAGCTWRVKDIRGELRLIDKVFTQQLDVLKEFAPVIGAEVGMSPELIKEQEATLIRDSGLEALRERIKRMDEDAATTIDGLSNITQAMLAQASLKEAESARLMNLIILPFTVVTVIFTPLSFMTSLFAVNSDGFPHNNDGELRIPSDWLRNKMIIGEIGTLVPLLILVVSISYLRTGRKNVPKQ
ncbi:unnamed protein product [Fusarium graminearum]|uniref:Chromosome 1, complete genome n=2 Tax=Gibberella zeae (strain ATCC MYA-4620 / CBS 123657 / FGSC 9075 / NRRL 31084 / PH-1) TaxID=229533 RepID=A0A098D0J2_GIBZE|nr:unnamed protein product [Fusarium graminearum]